MVKSVVTIPIRRIEGNAASQVEDSLAVEEPLEIQLGARSFSMTMRTPGNDLELAAGFLLAEGIITSAAEILSLQSSSDDPNICQVELVAEAVARPAPPERNFLITSACGVCGKASLAELASNKCPVLPADELRLDRDVLYRLSARLREAQSLFEVTGGLHAAALFSPDGELASLREDVGRHNAVDKLIGAALLQGLTPLVNSILLVSGRASFELVQKALVAGIPVLAAVGAPSSLAVATAERCGMTLIGFLRSGRFNVYTHACRVV